MYDIYSVGVILVELGLFKSTQNVILENKGSLNAPAEEIRRMLIERLFLKLNLHGRDIRQRSLHFFLYSPAICLK